MILAGSADAELQIIARDAIGLSKADRAILREAAEEYADTQRLLYSHVNAVAELRKQCAALAELNRALCIELNSLQYLKDYPSWMKFS